MAQLFPAIEPYRIGRFKVHQGNHEIYFEESGNPKGKPVVFVHGGPGAGTEGKQRRFFDPKVYRIILFDQRGCGKSTPRNSLEDNTIWHLIADMEQLRELLGIQKWQVFGGSWGSTLALAYSEAHPERVTELILRGIFMVRKWEIDWFYQKGADALYPDAWEEYVKVIPENERHDLVKAYYKRLTSTDKKLQMQAARAWSVWEGSTSKLVPNTDFINHYGEDSFALTFARIECHYFVNNCFWRVDDQLLQEVSKIRHIPAVIVQGRYDVVCPMRSAWDLHRAWPEADLRIITEAGHSAFEPGVAEELVKATNQFR